MSYRSDHDAALARVGALESELATLRRAQVIPPARPRPLPRPFGGRTAFALALVLGGGVAIGLAVAATPPAPAQGYLDVSPDVRAQLRACTKSGVHLDPACRALVDAIATDTLVDPAMRAAAGAWSAADRELEEIADWNSDAAKQALTHHEAALKQAGRLL